MYRQVYDPISHSLGLSALVAVLPLAVLFLLLGVLRMRAWLASVIALGVSLVVAIAAYGMSIGAALNSGAEGAVFGFYPILWIVINAIWIYRMTVNTGHFDVLRRSFGGVTDDARLQAVLIAFSFGALLEALAGFGTPVAITSVMLMAIGFKPLKAASLALVANTAPVAFGAIAVPITTLAKVTALPVDQVGSMVGRQTPELAVIVPLVLVFMVDGRRGLREVWPTSLACGVVFAIVQFAVSNYVSVPLTDIAASLASALVIVLVSRAGHLAGASRRTSVPVVAGGSADDVDPGFARRVESERQARAPEAKDSRGEVVRAYLPYAVIIVIFIIASLPGIKGVAPAAPHTAGTGIQTVTRIYAWPGLHVVNATGKPLSSLLFKFDWLAAAGTLLLIAGVISAILLRVSPAAAVRAYGETLVQLRTAIVTVMAVLALSYVMNTAGETTTLGRYVAQAGGAFAFLSPILGWLGTAVTGSDTSSNSLFGLLQVTAAKQTHLSPLLMASANSSGGVLGKMISPQNLAIGASAVGLSGQEGDVFRKVIGWSLLFLLLMCVLVYLQTTSVLSWMVP